MAWVALCHEIRRKDDKYGETLTQKKVYPKRVWGFLYLKHGGFVVVSPKEKSGEVVRGRPGQNAERRRAPDNVCTEADGGMVSPVFFKYYDTAMTTDTFAVVDIPGKLCKKNYNRLKTLVDYGADVEGAKLLVKHAMRYNQQGQQACSDGQTDDAESTLAAFGKDKFSDETFLEGAPCPLASSTMLAMPEEEEYELSSDEDSADTITPRRQPARSAYRSASDMEAMDDIDEQRGYETQGMFGSRRRAQHVHEREEESMGERSKQTTSSEGAVASMRDIQQYISYVEENVGHLDKETIVAGLVILAGRAPTLTNLQILGLHAVGVLLKITSLENYAKAALLRMETENEASTSSRICKAPVEVRSKLRPPTASLKSIDSRSGQKSVVAGGSAARGGGTQVQMRALSDDDDDDFLLSALDNYNESGSAKQSSSSPGRSRPSQLSRAPHSAAKAAPLSRAMSVLSLSPILSDDPIGRDDKKKVADGGGAVSPSRSKMSRRAVTPSRTAPKRAASAGRGAEKQF